MPSFGDLFTDLRGEDRTMRVSFHPDRGAVVLSLWSGTVCRGSFRMPVDDVDRLLVLLAEVRQAGTAVPPVDGDTGSGPATVAGTAEVVTPSVERTGDITAHRVAILPTPRVA
ncbi:hypothetical protein ACGFI9_26700 [Micromonospora sp. NPDC048930]|uniref:hypothetical protein n=1 Tax=Micromonospora sp. NPDC048930 TaxID=3364261 RepID=UPI003718F410